MLTNIVTAIRHPEEFQCSNTVEVIMWAWSVGVINPEDRAAWKSIQNETLRLHQIYEFRRLVALARHITDTNEGISYAHEWFLAAHYKNSPYRSGCVQKPVPALMDPPDMNQADLYPSQACQLRRLYCLAGYNPAT